jgi:hypothetical protein
MRNVFRWSLMFAVAAVAFVAIGSPVIAQQTAQLDLTTVGLAFIGMTAPMLPGRTAPQLLPFTMGTRKRTQSLGSFTFTPGTPVPTITIPQVGLLAKIRLRIEGTITQSAATGVFSPFGHAAMLNRVRVNANLGSASLVDVSGPGLEVANYWNNPASGPVKNTYGNAAAANRFTYGIEIPINANDRTLMHVGLINLQAEQVRVTLDVIPAALIGGFFVSGGGTLTPALTMSVEYEYWDVPNPARYQLPPASLVRLLEENFQITTTGDQIYTIPRLGTLAQLSEIFVIAGAMANLTGATPDITNFLMRANKTDTWLQHATAFAEQEEQSFYNNAAGSFLRPGVRTWDFFHSGMQERNFGDRDLINTEQITTLEFISTVASTVVPSTTSERRIVRRVFQRLV